MLGIKYGESCVVQDLKRRYSFVGRTYAVVIAFQRLVVAGYYSKRQNAPVILERKFDKDKRDYLNLSNSY